MIGNLVSYGRKSANFNRPSHRMTPSSSRHGLSFINWLFFGIGFPELKAVYSSRKTSRYAKLTISSSASLISSGNSSILAVLLSLLCMLCNTLLTLVTLFSLLRVLEPNASNWKTVSDEVSTLLVCSVSVQLLSEGYTS